MAFKLMDVHSFLPEYYTYVFSYVQYCHEFAGPAPGLLTCCSFTCFCEKTGHDTAYMICDPKLKGHSVFRVFGMRAKHL